jgi:hypothetical protein
MAVWAVAWAGSKPLASLADGSFATTLGVRTTGLILALPALMPILALVAITFWRRQQRRRRSAPVADAAPPQLTTVGG